MANRTNSVSNAFRYAAMAGAGAFAFLAGPLSADVKAGVDAWSDGDYDRAVSEWQMPAQTGDADALFNLAQAYRLGRGVEADIDRARELYAEAADKGHIKAADNYGLLLFQQGEHASAMPLIDAAAGRGDPRAQYVLGLAHFNADYAAKDWVRAYALLSLAQSAGLPQAASALQQMDEFVPPAQRQQAQSLARQLDEQAAQRRSVELAAVDLGTRSASAAPVLTAAAPAAPQLSTIAPSTITPRTASQRSVPASAIAANPEPVRVAQMTAPVSAPVPAPVRVPVAATQSAALAAGSWRVQLGAFGVAGNADRLWSQVSGNPALAGMRKALVPAGGITRLHAVGFASRGDAARACDALKRQGQGCMVAGSS
jgi:TPR repeat protein